MRCGILCFKSMRRWIDCHAWLFTQLVIPAGTHARLSCLTPFGLKTNLFQTDLCRNLGHRGSWFPRTPWEPGWPALRTVTERSAPQLYFHTASGMTRLHLRFIYRLTLRQDVVPCHFPNLES